VRAESDTQQEAQTQRKKQKSVGVKIRPCRDLELLGFVLLFYLVPSAEEASIGPRDTNLPYAPTTHTDLQQVGPTLRLRLC
jgi:hypothetical protein